MTSRILHTESGSVYEVEGTRVRRHNSSSPLAQDDRWIHLLAPLPQYSLVGASLYLFTDDDVLHTSRVTSDTWGDA